LKPHIAKFVVYSRPSFLVSVFAFSLASYFIDLDGVFANIFLYLLVCVAVSCAFSSRKSFSKSYDSLD